MPFKSMPCGKPLFYQSKQYITTDFYIFVGTAVTSGETQKRRFLAQQRIMQDLVLNLAMRYPTAQSLQFAATVVFRWSQVQGEQLAFLQKLSRRSDDVQVRALASDIRTARSSLSRLANERSPNPSKLRTILDELADLEIQLSHRSRVYRQHLAACRVGPTPTRPPHPIPRRVRPELPAPQPHRPPHRSSRRTQASFTHSPHELDAAAQTSLPSRYRALSSLWWDIARHRVHRGPRPHRANPRPSRRPRGGLRTPCTRTTAERFQSRTLGLAITRHFLTPPTGSEQLTLRLASLDHRLTPALPSFLHGSHLCRLQNASR